MIIDIGLFNYIMIITKYESSLFVIFAKSIPRFLYSKLSKTGVKSFKIHKYANCISMMDKSASTFLFDVAMSRPPI